jgi:hypothetical protein
VLALEIDQCSLGNLPGFHAKQGSNTNWQRADKLSMIETLCDEPIPVYLARAVGYDPPKWLEDWYFKKFGEWVRTVAKEGVVCRGVSLERLAYVLDHGVDVPTGCPLWVDLSLDKAWEYGGSRKLLIVLSNTFLQSSHHILPLDTPEKELEAYKKEYKTILRGEKETWLSRLPENDRRVGSPYEVAHCRFPNGDPRMALIALVIILPPDDELGSIEAILASHNYRARESR